MNFAVGQVKLDAYLPEGQVYQKPLMLSLLI